MYSYDYHPTKIWHIRAIDFKFMLQFKPKAFMGYFEHY